LKKKKLLVEKSLDRDNVVVPQKSKGAKNAYGSYLEDIVRGVALTVGPTLSSNKCYLKRRRLHLK
jgi:hypothetical protein